MVQTAESIGNIDWRKIRIEDCGEALVGLDDSGILEDAIYAGLGLSNENKVRLRSGIVEKLKEAQSILSKKMPGYRLKVWDGFRTLETQDLLFYNYLSDLYREHNNWSDDELKAAVNIFVSFPSEDVTAPSWHNTGGAIDLSIVGPDGHYLDMGTSFDEFNERAFTDYFANPEEASKKSGFPIERCLAIQKNRQLLKEIMEEFDFVNFENEWWHFSHGDQLWAAQSGSDKAIYGSMEL